MAPRKKTTPEPKVEEEKLDEGFDLGGFLNDYGAMAGMAAPEIEQNEGVEQLPRWTIVQPKNTYVDDTSLWGTIEVTLDPNEDERAYVRDLDMMLLGRVVTRSPFSNRLVGRRRLRDSNGDVVCASRNGLYPHIDYLGKRVYDPQFKRDYVIGTHDVPNVGAVIPISEGSICENCPMAQFRNRPDGSGRFAQLCKPNDRYIVWLRPRENPEADDEDGKWIIPPEGIIAMVTGTNNGLQAALEGTINRRGKDPAKKYGAGKNKDGFFELFGAEYWFDVEGAVEVGDQELPTYRNAPNGQPIQVLAASGGKEFPDIFPVTVTVVGNNFINQEGGANPTLVPHFNLAKAPLSKAEYKAYLDAVKIFTDEEIIAKQLAVPEKRPEFALPSGNEITVENPAEDDDVEEGEYVDVDLDELT